MKKRLIAVITFALVLLSSCGGQSGLNDDTTSVGRYENSRIENREGSETESSARSSFLESESEPSTVSKAESNPSSTPQAPAFHVSEYIQLAKNYGQNVGLALDSTATDCWDDPITANANCRYLKRDIQDRLDWYKASGFTAFWVWSEQVGSGEYLIYIGYA